MEPPCQNASARLRADSGARETGRICSVQCMLLWSEWVRAFRRRISGFPKLIGKEEFHNAIADRFGAEMAYDGYRGAVYTGIRFVP
ncbi:hypothetical protein [Methanoregula sp.]|uniref:hypothetical protein n=1 Tax=Methanoregula sp. TaxID=2052170 RepID=UPI003BAFEB47